MSDQAQTGACCNLGNIREAVCIHTKKILDSCIDKDCIEDLRVYLTRDSQAILDRATSVKARCAELLYAFLDVESVSFNRGFYTVDITFYYRIIVDAIVGGTRPGTIYGIAVFTKRVMLFGSEGCTKIFSSKTVLGGLDKQMMVQSNKPEAVVDVIEPIILSARISDAADSCRCGCGCDTEIAALPEAISCCFDDELVLGGDGKRLFVTIGQFSIIRLERDAQLLIPAYDYCVPQKECSAMAGATEASPCEMFSQLAFPVDSFFPPQTPTALARSNATNDTCTSCAAAAAAATVPASPGPVIPTTGRCGR